MRTKFGAGGYYDDSGKWVKLKHCFLYCGPERCDCSPPGGVYQLPPMMIEEIKEEQNDDNSEGTDRG